MTELRSALAEYSEEDVSRVIERLLRHGLLNDEKLAAKLVEKSVGKSAIGRDALAEKLRLRGADEEIVLRALNAMPDEAERARRLLESRHSAPPATLGRYLISKGFEPEIVDHVLNQRLGTSE